jgi:two-component system phosphate regulon response regulator PhoB
MPPTNEKILLVEDSESMREVLSAKLEQEGYNIETTATGKKGLDKAKTFQPDLIVLDLMLPQINGLDVLEKLKENEQTDQIPVVIYSQIKDQDKIDKGMKMGAEGYFVKSESDLDGVMQSIKSYLKMGAIEGI